MERFTKENSQNIKSIFEAGTDIKLPKHKMMRPHKILSIVIAVIIVLAGTGTVLASTTTFTLLLGDKMVDLEWEPIEQFDIDSFNEYCRQIGSDVCPDLDKAEELTGIKLIKTDRFTISYPSVHIYEPVGEVKFACDLWIDGKGAKVNAIAVFVSIAYNMFSVF